METPGVANFKAMLEHRDGLVKVPFAEVEQAKAVTGGDEAEGVSSRLGYLNGFFSWGNPLRKLTQLSKAPHQPSAGYYGRYGGCPQALIEEIAWERIDGPSEGVGRSPIVAHGDTGLAEENGRIHLEDNIPQGCSNSTCSLPTLHRAFGGTHQPPTGYRRG